MLVLACPSRPRRAGFSGSIWLRGTGELGSIGDGGLATRARLWFAAGVAVDAAGNIVIADSFNNRVRRVDAASGKIETVVGTGQQGSLR